MTKSHLAIALCTASMTIAIGSLVAHAQPSAAADEAGKKTSRASAALQAAKLNPGTAVQLTGGVRLTPAAPRSGQALIKKAEKIDYVGPDAQKPDGAYQGAEGSKILMSYPTVANQLYVIECRVGGTLFPSTVKFGVNGTTSTVQTQEGFGLYAFRAQGASTNIDLSMAKAGDSYPSFQNCELSKAN